jgi:hypothetical protein
MALHGADINRRASDVQEHFRNTTRWGDGLSRLFAQKLIFESVPSLTGTDGRARMETSVRGVLAGHGAVDTTYG